MDSLTNYLTTCHKKPTKALFKPFGENSVKNARRLIHPSAATFLTAGFAAMAISSLFLKDLNVSRILLNISMGGLITINTLASKKFATQGHINQTENVAEGKLPNEYVSNARKFVYPLGHPNDRIRKFCNFSLFQAVILGAGTIYLSAVLCNKLPGRVAHALIGGSIGLMICGAAVSARFLGRHYVGQKLNVFNRMLTSI
jgi:hypothetical protein